MTVSRKAMCVCYGLIGTLALVGTWGNVLGILPQVGFWEGNVRFWQDTLANESTRFITVDILFLGWTVIVWMVLEARRLEIPGVWLYVVGGLLIAISLAVPLFMIHRERRLAARESGSPAGRLGPADLAGILVLGLVILAYTAVALSRGGGV